jgi:DNA-binding NarL/FixJ family response regulator
MHDPIKILIVNGDAAFGPALHTWLQDARGLAVVGRIVGQIDREPAALAQIAALAPEVILLSLGPLHPEHVRTVADLHRRHPAGRLLVLGAGASPPRLVLDLFRNGAQGYLDRDACQPPHLLAAIHTLHRGGAVLDPGLAGWMLREIARLRRKTSQHD